MSTPGPMEILVILVVALIVLGPTKLPDAARSVGKALGELRRLSSGFQRELQNAMDDPAPTKPPAAGGPPVPRPPLEALPPPPGGGEHAGPPTR